MSDRTQDLKNLRAVATACKNYTDKKAEEILWQVGEYSISTSDDNTTASSKTVPSGATRCKIKRIYGNSVKYAPSTASDDTTANLKVIPENTYNANVDTIGNTTTKLNPTFASDDTTALVKTMPTTVYDFDVSKVDGASEVSENLILEQKQVTLTAGSERWVSWNITGLVVGQTYTIIIFNSQSSNEVWQMTNYSFMGFSYNTPRTITATSTTLNVRVGANTLNDDINYPSKLMLVKGSVVPTEFKQGYEGIHNFEWTGVKAEGFNKWDEQWEVGGYNFSNGNTAVYNNRIRSKSTNYISVIPNATYYIHCGNTSAKWCPFFYDKNYNYVGSIDNSYVDISYYTNTTFTIPLNAYYLRFYLTSVYGTTYNNDVCINLSSSANGTYQSYITPTTTTIDLSTITYNDSPLFEENSLKGVGTAKDYITPILAHKQMDYIDLGSLNWTKDSYNNWLSDVNSILAKSQLNCLCSKYPVVANPEDVDYGCKVSGNLNRVVIHDKDTLSMTASEFKTYVNGVMFIYELATPIEVSIDWSSILRGIQGYSNGTISLLNTYDMPVSSEIRYNSIIENDYADSVVFSGNMISCESFDNNGAEYNADTCYFKYKGTNQYYALPSSITLPKGTYTIQRSTNANQLYLYDSSNNVIFAMNGTTSQTKTFDSDVTITKFASWNGVWEGYLAIYKGSTAPSVFKPYIAPITKAIPSEIKALDGYTYGTDTTPNFINLNNKKFIQNVIKTTNTTNFNYVDSYTKNNITYTHFRISLSDNLPNAGTSNILANYNFVNIGGSYSTNREGSWIGATSSTSQPWALQATIEESIVGNTTESIRTYFTNNPLILYYELATPVETDISSYLTNFNPILTNNNYTNYEVISHNGTALPNKISYYGTIKETLCTAIEQRRNGTLIKTINLPNITSDGWSASSTVLNYRDVEGKIRHKVVGRIDMGTLTYNLTINNNRYLYKTTIDDIIGQISSGNNIKALSSIYNATSTDSTWVDKDMAYTTTTVGSKSITFVNNDYATVEAFTTAMSGVYLYYELATEDTETISEIENVIEVQPGDTFIFVNANNQAVPSDLTYRIEVAN